MTDKKKRKHKPHKPHEFDKKNENGKNDTRPVEWTDAAILKEVDHIRRMLLADDREIRVREKDRKGKDKPERTIAVGYKYVFIGQLFIGRGYSRQRFSEWRTHYAAPAPQDATPEQRLVRKNISDAIREIDDIMESRSWEGGMKGDLNPHITKFHLINNHGAKPEELGLKHSGKVDGDQNIFLHAIRKAKELKS